MIPDSQGECAYLAGMALTNTAPSSISSLILYIQIYDPELQKGFAVITLPEKDLKPKTKELTASLKVHCRSHDTVRAFIQD